MGMTVWPLAYGTQRPSTSDSMDVTRRMRRDPSGISSPLLNETTGYENAEPDHVAPTVAAAASMRHGWRWPYVSDRQSHSSGPNRNRASHQRLNAALSAKNTRPVPSACSGVSVTWSA